MKNVILIFAMLLLCGCAYERDRDPHREVERDAVPSESHPYAGFWKENLSDDWGLAVGPHSEGEYYVSFCGRGGCFARDGDGSVITSFENDPDFRIIDLNTIEAPGGIFGFATKYFRSDGRELTTAR